MNRFLSLPIKPNTIFYGVTTGGRPSGVPTWPISSRHLDGCATLSLILTKTSFCTVRDLASNSTTPLYTGIVGYTFGSWERERLITYTHAI